MTLVFAGSLFISFESVININMQNRLAPPSWSIPFGADIFGRSMLLRVLYGTRYSLAIAFGAVGLASIIGILLGALAGYLGGLTEEIVMRFSDILASIPSLLLGMVIMVVLGQSLPNLILAVGVNTIPAFTRITRASILTVRGNEYVEAARAIGLPNIRIILAQVLPNGLSPIIVTFTLSLGMAIIMSSSLSFLGFGVPVPTPEWGLLIAEGRDHVRIAPHLMIFPGLFIMLTVLSFNLLGDGLRDALDPKLKK
jgi:peptide/nickel transport system permease protein